jgi:dsRNA-specific ribonuclease
MTDPIYNGEPTVKLYGFRYPVIKDSVSTSIVHKPDINKFRQFIFNLITERGNINESAAQSLLDEKGLERFKMAFTHSSVVGETSYEFFEMLGDRSVNKAIIWYMHRRFPEIEKNEKSAMYMTQLKIKYENKRNFGAWARKLSFDEYIQYTELSYVEGKYIKKVRVNDSMLEDAFESFCGVLEDLIDSRIGIGVGYGIVYNIVTSLLDEEYITTDLRQLVDVKTQVKELLEDKEIRKLGSKFSYNTYQDGDRKFVTSLQLHFDNSPCEKYVGKLDMEFKSNPSFKKIDSENDVAKQTLDWLSKECKLNWIDFK